MLPYSNYRRAQEHMHVEESRFTLSCGATIHKKVQSSKDFVGFVCSNTYSSCDSLLQQMNYPTIQTELQQFDIFYLNRRKRFKKKKKMEEDSLSLNYYWKLAFLNVWTPENLFIFKTESQNCVYISR